ncbi:MAG: EVE domain-containing protein [Caldilineaceae bacterium]|nr:EVE domain-containing protein [Caldilineaceae bacterium]MBP8107418.1 EVE domain-containing protein [Caldilineaceae bacterium]MBP8123353.1 EVE domain-containing protein [Caldilineaceae bacterium]MBP9070961.1 EVE domain-containing protein [Caldilineaceae bacterium]
MSSKQFWIGVVSRAHVQIGVSGGFVQLNHGKRAPLQKLHAGDGFVYYSPKTSFPAGDPCQAFTAIGRVKSAEIYQADMGDDFHPYRVDVQYLDAQESPIRPLLNGLSFIKDKTHWGAAFRFGHLKVPAQDFKIIAEAMGCDFERDFGG